MQKALNLVNKTGDRIVIYDSSKPDQIFVVMSLNEYERMAIKDHNISNLTESQLLDKINRDIAIWKNEQFIKEELAKKEEDFLANEENRIEKIRENQFYNNLGAEPNYLNFEKENDMANPAKDMKKRQWQIPADRKLGAEEVIEEDRQYLEEVTY